LFASRAGVLEVQLEPGASSWLAPSLTLLILMMGPGIVTSFFLRDPGYVAFRIMTAVYLGFLIAQTRCNWRAFWSATVAAKR
jgi:hypothetical protein